METPQTIVHCPECNRVMSAKEIAEGMCINCGHELFGSPLAEVSAWGLQC